MYFRIPENLYHLYLLKYNFLLCNKRTEHVCTYNMCIHKSCICFELTEWKLPLSSYFNELNKILPAVSQLIDFKRQMRSPQEIQITSLNISNLSCNNQPPIKSNLIITSYCDQHCFVIHHTRWEQPVTRIRCRVCMYKCIGEQQGCQKWLSPCSNYHTISQEVLPSRREVPCLSLFRVISMRPRTLSNCHHDEGIWGVRSINFVVEQRVEGGRVLIFEAVETPK